MHFQQLLEMEKIGRTEYKALGEIRLEEFKALRKATLFLSAIHVSGYAVEAFLKCAVCKTMNSLALPRIFRIHDLDTLLLYSGLTDDLNSNAIRADSFKKFKGAWEGGNLRYQLPSPAHTDVECGNIDSWLNDVNDGIITYLRGHI